MATTSFNLGSAPLIAPLVNEVSFNFVHEVSPNLSAVPQQEQTRVVEASPRPTVVTARSSVVIAPARGMRSPEYTAIVRRRRVHKVANLIESLAEFCEQADFPSHTFPIVQEIRETLSFLSLAQETEGNASAVLRYVRNTILDGGWNHYKKIEGRDAALKALAPLADHEEVDSDDARRAFDLLLNSGMSPSLPMAIDNDAEEDAGEYVETADEVAD